MRTKFWAQAENIDVSKFLWKFFEHMTFHSNAFFLLNGSRFFDFQRREHTAFWMVVFDM